MYEARISFTYTIFNIKVQIMKKSISTKQLGTLVIALLIAFALIFTAQMITPTAYAEHENGIWQETVNVTNNQFADTDGASPAQPSSWTGGYLGGSSSDAIFGVLNTDLSSYDYDADPFEIKGNTAEYRSPFGKTGAEAIEDTNTNVLLIKSDGGAAYGYTSTGLSLAANSYYEISVWAKTNIKGGKGAAFLINGLTDEPIGIIGIRTDSAEMEGFEEYTIYIETSRLISKEVTISLQLGHEGTGGTVSGYVMFDNLTAKRISAGMFCERIETAKAPVDEQTTVTNANSFVYSLVDIVTIGDFETAETTPELFGGTYIKSGITVDNSSIYSPTSASTYNNAAYLSSENAVYAGARTCEFTIERYSYKVISAWLYAKDVDGTNGVSATLYYKSALNAAAEFTTETATSISYTSDSNHAHYGWTLVNFYVKGSDYADYTAKFEISLGTEDSKSSGTIAIDEFTITNILPQFYSDNSSNGSKAVSLDSASDGSGITNGWLDLVGTYEELDDITFEGGKLSSPLPVSGWTQIDASTTGESGFSTASVDMSKATHGLVPANAAAGKLYGNMLMLSSDIETAYGYKSTFFSLAADSYNELSVNVYVPGALSGYGANLVLKCEEKTVSTIEKITKSGTYKFYISNEIEDYTYNIELWLGLADRSSNASKLASGTVYFTEVTLNTDSTEDTFNAKAESYASQRTNDEVKYGINFAVADLRTENLFSLYDSYDNSSVKRIYNWTLQTEGNAVYGVYDAYNRSDDTSVVPAKFENGDKQYAIVLKHNVPTYSTLSFDNTFTATADSYYKLSVSVKTYFPQDYLADDCKAKGAHINMFTTEGDNFGFEFKRTYDVDTDHSDAKPESYRVYTYYLKTSSEDTEVGLTFSLGGTSKSYYATLGTLFINDISFELISNVDYDAAIANLDDDENFIDDYTQRAVFATTDDSDDDTTDSSTDDDMSYSDTNWMLIPSILLFVAVIIAMAGWFIRKLIEKRRAVRKTAKARATVASYDRRWLDSVDDEATDVDAKLVTDETDKETAVDEPSSVAEADVAPEVETAVDEPEETAKAAETVSGEALVEEATEATTDVAEVATKADETLETEATETPTDETTADETTVTGAGESDSSEADDFED